ncbi:MAG: N-acetyltransferase [Rhodobacteraceae bacterium]|jgi:L-amino acid N-acyltransferase YncA|uniref:Phosphinothricin acetyltransferase n=1 Tax=Salipiger profundus TaxID=1229727 RepID=A0A1U7D034_9RHOB|nr:MULTISPECIES: GNAT family N-acetyltransferase [Salipiger]APX21492.1 phosphinothricin acetyltransferase [Salipiger profundus]MAB08898.1 N-acetyltransferase [Paracoccaceae bacterium]GGA01960.1 N-acetyltransferase [Salipiger profundus]SFC18541.1 phosphinothricin acetyltransferase [Salipiger profundus]
MIVRPARAEDAAPLVALWNPWIRDTAITFTTDEKTEAGLAADIAARGPAFVVAEDGGALLGFATFFPFRAGPGYAWTKEHTVILAPEARGRGAGRALMAALEDEAQRQGVHALMAGISAENPAGVAFHAAIGFHEVARLPQVGRKFDRWMDLVLMQKFP